MLEVENINQYYGGSHILKDVSFSAEVGECTVILGQNGAGKTTLMNVLMGHLPAASGRISLANQDITSYAVQRRVKQDMAYVPQGRDVFSTLSIEENIFTGRAKFSGAKARVIPDFIYELFPVLKEMKDRRAGDLSGGQQQQLAIARALATEPKVLLLDEPTEGIQPSIIKDIGEIIKKIVAQGDVAVILVEQYYDFAEELADKYLILNRGEVIKSGAGQDMQADGIKELVCI